jgi:hypothetical protein
MRARSASVSTPLSRCLALSLPFIAFVRLSRPRRLVERLVERLRGDPGRESRRGGPVEVPSRVPVESLVRGLRASAGSATASAAARAASNRLASGGPPSEASIAASRVHPRHYIGAPRGEAGPRDQHLELRKLGAPPGRAGPGPARRAVRAPGTSRMRLHVPAPLRFSEGPRREATAQACRQDLRPPRLGRAPPPTRGRARRAARPPAPAGSRHPAPAPPADATSASMSIARAPRRSPARISTTHAASARSM